MHNVKLAPVTYKALKLIAILWITGLKCIHNNNIMHSIRSYAAKLYW